MSLSDCQDNQESQINKDSSTDDFSQAKSLNERLRFLNVHLDELSEELSELLYSARNGDLWWTDKGGAI